MRCVQPEKAPAKMSHKTSVKHYSPNWVLLCDIKDVRCAYPLLTTTAELLPSGPNPKEGCKELTKYFGDPMQACLGVGGVMLQA